MKNNKHSFQWIGMIPDGDQVVLNRFEERNLVDLECASEVDPSECDYGVVVDFETTGWSATDNEIIEIGLRRFLYRKSDSKFVRLDQSYQSFQEPLKGIPPIIQKITGITPELVKNQKIDWDTVELILKDAAIIIAHNAGFDRPFMDRQLLLSQEKLWGCSVKNIQWIDKGFPSAKLELLSVYHGFYHSAHRALNDVESLLFLLTFQDASTQKSYLHELITNAQQPSYLVEAKKSPFDKKDLLKLRGYRWNSKDTVWSKRIEPVELKTEIQWLTQEVYQGKFMGEYREISSKDQFKN